MGKTKIIILLFILVSLISASQGFWLDEAIGVVAVHKFSYSEIITKFMLADNHPPFYYLILKFWINIFGASEFAVRSLSITAGALTIHAAYLVATELSKRTTSKQAGVLTALLLASSQFFVYYSQEARMYIFTALFATLSVYFFIKALDKNRGKYWFMFSVSLAALMFTDYVPVFMLPVFWIYMFFARKISNNIWKPFLLSHGVLLLFGVFWLPMFLKQIESGKWLLANFDTWRTVAGGANLKQILLVWMKFTSGRISFYPKIIYYSYVSAASIPFVVVFLSFIRKTKKNLLLSLWFVLPVLIGFVTSTFFPAFIYFRFIFVLPALAVVVSITAINYKKTLKTIVITWIVIFNILSITIYSVDANQQREQWIEALKYVENIDKNSVVLFEFPKPFAPVEWYGKDASHMHGATNSIYADRDETKDRTKNLIVDKQYVYHFDYLRDLSDPNRYVEDALSINGFIKTGEEARFIGVGKISIWEKE
ncbi:hypothetical protein C4564_04165 [Candidatus Microgenomates bacterium]|nr:MAG: hypothetical protein C4564_04165 [Candidatus Microgenomates bacterium]